MGSRDRERDRDRDRDRDRKKKKRRYSTSSSESRSSSYDSERSDRHYRKKKVKKSEKTKERNSSSESESKKKAAQSQQQQTNQFQMNQFGMGMGGMGMGGMGNMGMMGMPGMPGMPGMGMMGQPNQGFPFFNMQNMGNMMKGMKGNNMMGMMGMPGMPGMPGMQGMPGMPNMNPMGQMDFPGMMPGQQQQQNMMGNNLQGNKKPVTPQMHQNKQPGQPALLMHNKTQQNPSMPTSIQSNLSNPLHPSNLNQPEKNIIRDYNDPEHFSAFRNRYIIPLVSEYLMSCQLNSEVCDKDSILILVKKLLENLEQKSKDIHNRKVTKDVQLFLEKIEQELDLEMHRQKKILKQQQENGSFIPFKVNPHKCNETEILKMIHDQQQLVDILSSKDISNSTLDLGQSLNRLNQELKFDAEQDDIYNEAVELLNNIDDIEQKIEIEQE